MSLPIFHSLAGYSIYRLSRSSQEEQDWKLALYCILLANAADFDFVPGILLGNAARFHHGGMHSFGAAMICGVIAGMVFGMWKKKFSSKVFLVSSCAYASHIVLDYFNDAHNGLPVFWPLSAVKLPVTLTVFQWAGRWEPLAGSGFGAFWDYLSNASRLEQWGAEILFVSLILLGFSAHARFKKRISIKEPAFLLKKD